MGNGYHINRRTFLEATGAFGFLGMAGSAAAASRTRGKRNELLVGVAPSAAGVRRTAERALPAEARVVHENARLGYVTVELPDRASATAKAAVADAIENRRGIEYVETNTVHEALFVPNDPRFEEQYAPRMVNVPAAWDITRGERDVTVAVVDTGVKYDHPDLDGKFGSDAGRDFADADGDPYPDVLGEEHHGTHVAGIAAGEIDNDEGIAGIADATLLSVRALNEKGLGYTSNIADGIQWAADEGVDVINLSLGGGGYTETMQRAVAYAYGNGVVLVAAAGNEYGGPVLYPAAYEECIAVSALDRDGGLADYSNTGPAVELCAPGTSLLSTWTDDGYANLSGTSMATPVVAGVAALVCSQGDRTNEEVRTRLKNTAVDMGLSSDEQGSGRADAAAAVERSRAQTLTIQGVNDTVRYDFSVTGSVRENYGVETQWADRIDGNTGSGVVGPSQDSYAFSGELVHLDVSGQAIVHLNGERIDATDYPNNVLTVHGVDGTVRYEFAATGNVEENYGVEQQWADHIDGNTGSGVVGPSRDSYAFSGELVRFDVDGQAVVHLNGERIDPADYPDSVLTIQGVNDTVRYEFSATEGVGENYGVEQQWADRISGTTASGIVGPSQDSYTFSGELVRLDVDGQANVHLNGDRIDPADYPDNILIIQGVNDTVRYDFSVTGRVGENYGVETQWADSIDGSTASGVVGPSQDSYVFSGELVQLNVDGQAMIHLNGERIDSADTSPTVGVYSGLSDADFDTIDRMEEWQGSPYAVQNLFVPWNPDEGHMNWLFDHILPKIWANGRVPLITWEPYTPGARATSVDTQSLVERGEYTAYLQSLADTTPNDIEVRIGNGDYDSYIDTWASRLREWLAGPDGKMGTADDRRAYIRLAHEMNGDWYPWSPAVGDSSPRSYVEMWRHVRRRFERRGIGAGVEWMWCVNADDVGPYSAEELYPGDAHVDWLAVDGYQWGRSQNWSRWESPETIFSNMFGRVRSLADKPLCVPETASSSKTGWGYDPARKDEWIRNAFEYFDNEGIELWCWFNEDKETDWAMFWGVRGTEKVTHNGEQINAYAAYREALDAYSATASTMESEPMTTGGFASK